MSRPRNRPRGILSQADRAFLLGEATLESQQSVYDTRYRIRQRMQNAIMDFSILFNRLETKDIEQVFSPSPEDREEFTEALVDAMAFFCLGIEQYDFSRESLLAESIRRVEQRCSDDQVIISAHVTVERADHDRLSSILDRIEAGNIHELTNEELRAFAQLCETGCNMSPREALDQRLRDQS